MNEQEINYTRIRDIVRHLNDKGVAISSDTIIRYCKKNSIEVYKSSVIKTQARDICIYFSVAAKKSKVPTSESYQCGLASALGYPT